MTKPYHLTQEQASNLLEDLHIAGLIASNSLDTEDFTIAVNAVLDEVLGEPVATKCISDPNDEREGLWFDLEDIAWMKALKAGTKLYAPKELKWADFFLFYG